MTNLPWSGMSGVILATVVILGAFLVWRMLKELRSGFPLKDERTLKVSGKAAYYAFHLGSYFMIALMLLNILSREFIGVYLLDGWYALNFAIIVQSLMYLGFRLYYEKKDDFQ
jgi:uncharacterized membrane protein